MDAVNVKVRPLSKDETKVLLSLVESSKVVNNKTTNATSNKMKNEEWVRITHSFNATTLCRRTPQQLRLKWENLKKNARKRYTAIRMNSLKTGGGPPDYIPPDDILDRVATLLGGTVDGFTVELGGDAEPSESSAITIFASDGGDSGDGGSIIVACDPQDIELGNIISEASGSSIATTTPVTVRLPKRMNLMSTPRASGFKRKLVKADDDERRARNIAIAEYYSSKKHLDAEVEKILLENEKMKLEIEQ